VSHYPLGRAGVRICAKAFVLVGLNGRGGLSGGVPSTSLACRYMVARLAAASRVPGTAQTPSTAGQASRATQPEGMLNTYSRPAYALSRSLRNACSSRMAVPCFSAARIFVAPGLAPTTR